MPLYSTGCGIIPLFYDYGTTGSTTCYLGSVATSADDLGLNNYRSISITNPGSFVARALTIDATDDLPALTEGLRNNTGSATLTFGGVLIGIPTLEIYINNLSMTPVYDGDVNGASSTAVNDDSHVLGTTLGFTQPNFGTIVLEGVTFTTLSGWLEIAPH
jgi:hypothetical protein